MPTLPPIQKPGWLLNYGKILMDPTTRSFGLENLFGDVFAGITVALLLIPQGLSYATLALLPPITGLYSGILPPAIYVIFGSSMQLAVGPVAIASLLTGAIISKYQVDYVNHPEDAMDLAAQISICLGMMLVFMSVFNIGSLIRLISHPVMSGFTTAAACLIGLSQLKNAFGFSVAVPQQGDPNTAYNYQVMQWYAANWNSRYPESAGGRLYRNPIATKIFFGLYAPLIIIQRLKAVIPATAERKQLLWFRIWSLFANLSSFIAIVISAKVAYDIISPNYSHGKIDDFYVKNLKIVGQVVPGLNIIRIPSFKYPWGELFLDVLPLTFIAFMESFSIATKLATLNKQLHFLNSNQELWAIGIANIVGSIGSCYPVAGSYSRSSLNAAAGAKTPLSAVVEVCVLLICLSVATKALFFIPQAALAAVIWVALYNIIAFTEWWEAYTTSFKDFFVLIITFTITFVFDTSIGLGAGIATSLIVFLFENIFSARNTPVSKQVGKGKQRIEIIRLNTDLNFLTVPRIKDFIAFGVLLRDSPPHAIIIDFVDVKHIDSTALKVFAEIKSECHEMHILFVTTNVIPDVAADLIKGGICTDCGQWEVLEGEHREDTATEHAEEINYDVKRGFVELQENPDKMAKKVEELPSMQSFVYDI